MQNSTFFSDSFEFIAPVTPDECTPRLMLLHQKASFFQHRTSVTMQQIDHNSWRFRIYRPIGRNIAIEASGYILPQGENVTLVRGAVRIAPVFWIIGGLIYLAHLMMMSIMFIATQSPFALLWLIVLHLMVSFFLLRLRFARHRLIEAIVQVVTQGSLDRKSKRKQVDDADG